MSVSEEPNADRYPKEKSGVPSEFKMSILDRTFFQLSNLGKDAPARGSQELVV